MGVVQLVTPKTIELDEAITILENLVQRMKDREIDAVVATLIGKNVHDTVLATVGDVSALTMIGALDLSKQDVIDWMEEDNAG